jgi:hypothetical protein
MDIANLPPRRECSTHLLQSIWRVWPHLSPELLELLKYELDKHVYYFGQHFSHPYEGAYPPEHKLPIVEQALRMFSANIERLNLVPNLVEELHRGRSSETLVCNAYFAWRKELEKVGWRVESPIWSNDQPLNEVEAIFRQQCALINELFRVDFRLLLDQTFLSALRETMKLVDLYYSSPIFKGVIVPYTLPFFEGYTIKYFQRTARPTFLAMHGILSCHHGWGMREHHTDFYVTWGPTLAKELIGAGLNPKQVIAAGHPDYQNVSVDSLRFDLNDVLVLGRCSMGAPSLHFPIYQNRSEQLDYVYRIQAVLKNAGVERARLRPHPSESPQWYASFVDTDFYQLDLAPLQQSIDSSSLAIGPVSSMLVDCAVRGLNYLIFDPADDYNPLDLHNYKPGLPFNGEDSRIPVAKTDQDLELFLTNKRAVNPSFISDYVGERFKPELITEAIRAFSKE